MRGQRSQYRDGKGEAGPSSDLLVATVPIDHCQRDVGQCQPSSPPLVPLVTGAALGAKPFSTPQSSLGLAVLLPVLWPGPVQRDDSATLNPARCTFLPRAAYPGVVSSLLFQLQDFLFRPRPPRAL